MRQVLKPALISGLLIVGLHAQNWEDALRPFWSAQGFNAASLSRIASNQTHLDPAVITFNPAHLGLISQPQAYLTLQWGRFNQAGRMNQAANSLNAHERYLRPSGFGVFYPVSVYQGSWVMGITFAPVTQYNTLLKTQNLTTENDDNVTLTHAINESGTLSALRLGSAVEFRPNFFIGLSLNLLRGSRRYSFIGTDTDDLDLYTYSRFIYEESINPEYRGWNADLGLIFHSKFYRFGLRISSPIKLNVQEASYTKWYETYDNASDSTIYNEFNPSYRTTYPFEIAPQLALTLRGITIHFDFILHDWTRIRFESDNIVDSNGDRIDSKVNSDLKWNLKPTTEMGVGLTFPLGSHLTFQAAGRLVPSPYYTTADDERNLILLGTGLDLRVQELVTIAFGYQAAIGKRTLTNTYFGTTNTQKFNEQQLIVSTSVRF